jgi:tetratricopeptide (TPR) repeat protein
LASLSTAARRFPEGEACAAYSEGGIGSLSGDLRTALASYRLAVRLGERLGLLHLMNQAAEDLGRIYTAIGRADEAVATLQDLPLADDPCARATSALNRAEAFMAAASAHARTDSDGPAHGARAREAIVFARRATGFCGDPHRRVLATTYALDDALERGDREAADEAASALLAKGEHPDALASVWRDDAVGRWLLARGRAAEALASFDEARALARSAGIEEEVVRAEVGAGRALLVLGRRRRAVTRFRMAAQELRGALAGIPVAEGRGEFLRGHDEAFRYLVEALVNEGTPREAWNVARAARRAEFVSLARAQRLGLLSPAARQAWEQAIERYARLRHVLELESADDWKLSRGELARIRAGRQVRAEQARQALDEAYRILGGAEVAGDRPEEPTPEGQVELLFFPGPREGASWFVFTRVGASVRVRTVPASGLANNEAASRVLVVMSPELARARRLRLLTYDLADRIDWQSVSWRGAKLSKTLEVTYGLDLQAEGRTASVGAGNIVLVGDPTGDLPGAREEAEMLAEKLARGRLLRLDGGAATRDAVLSALAGASLFHYAGHAESLGPSGMSSALLTAGGSRIELGDLLAAPRVPAGVVLSACEAAASTPRSLMGIAQGFLIAGAEAVIAAPRAVKDVSARTFMVNLYAHLTNADVPALEKAYREALLTADQTDAQMFRLVVQ